MSDRYQVAATRPDGTYCAPDDPEAAEFEVTGAEELGATADLAAARLLCDALNTAFAAGAASRSLAILRLLDERLV